MPLRALPAPSLRVVFTLMSRSAPRVAAKDAAAPPYRAGAVCRAAPRHAAPSVYRLTFHHAYRAAAVLPMQCCRCRRYVHREQPPASRATAPLMRMPFACALAAAAAATTPPFAAATTHR